MLEREITGRIESTDVKPQIVKQKGDCQSKIVVWTITFEEH
jgi:hypothetical protein